ncbi:hypothetical protein N7523_000375 [Penicillium sp. IBT 18751x]|nr:hypothetical protein N7523_000375 [Penicillium sp. IBT 18751x]
MPWLASLQVTTALESPDVPYQDTKVKPEFVDRLKGSKVIASRYCASFVLDEELGAQSAFIVSRDLLADDTSERLGARSSKLRNQSEIDGN